METRSKRRRLLQSYVLLQWLDLPATFESLNDDTLTTILQFVGNYSYKSFCVNKRCKEVYLAAKGMTKETFLFGYGPLSRITDRIERSDMENDQKLQVALGLGDLQVAVGKGVVLYNRRDVMDWALDERNTFTLRGICAVAAKAERFGLLEEVFNGVEDWDEKGDVFKSLDLSAVCYGEPNVLEWLVTHQLDIDEKRCAEIATHLGRIHIIQWLQEEAGLELFGDLYCSAIQGVHLHVMKWLREQACPWNEFTFHYAAKKGNLAILQWLHDEGCHWDRRVRVDELGIEPVVLDWLRVNGYVN